jgi:hypothetical protein
MDIIHSAWDFYAFHVIVTVRYGKYKPACSWFLYHEHHRLCSVRFACEVDGMIFYNIYFFITSIFFYYFYKYIQLTPFFSCRLQFLDASQARLSFLLKCICGVITVKKRCNSSWITKLITLWYVGFQPFFPVDPIDIGCTNSLTVQPRTCRWSTMFQLLDACNWFQALKPQSSRQCWTN